MTEDINITGNVNVGDNEGSASGSVDVTTPIKQEPVVSDFNFRDHLSDEFKTNKTLEQYKDLNGLAKSHIELNKMMGSSVRIPGEDATEEDLNKFYTKLGRPETSEKYELQNPKELPEGFEIQEEGVKEFKELAFKLGLSNKQADELRSFYVNKAVENYNSNIVDTQKIEEEFIQKGKEVYGDKYDAMMQNASKMISENLTEEQKAGLDKLDNESLLNVAVLLNNIHSKFFKPDTIQNNYSQANTQEDMKKELSELVKKRNEMSINDKFNPELPTIEKKVNELYAKGVKIF